MFTKLLARPVLRLCFSARNMGNYGSKNVQKREYGSKTIKLNSGFEMPVVGLGMWQSDNSKSVETALNAAIEAGYRHIDTALLYENESIIGATLQKMFKDGKIKREELFIVTKLPPNGMHPENVPYFFNKSLQSLQLDYLDLYLIHFPVPTKRTENDYEGYPAENNELAIDTSVTLENTWRAMESLVEQGLVRSIGLSNCNSKQVQRIFEFSKIKPASLQVECHAYLPQVNLANFCQRLNIALTAYSPLGTPGLTHFIKRKYNLDIPQEILLDDQRVKEIAAKHQKSPAQILLRFLIERDIVVIPKSSNPDRIKANIEIFNFSLDENDKTILLSMDKNHRYFSFSQYPNMLTHPEYPFNIPF